jgi:hypothetical protein
LFSKIADKVLLKMSNGILTPGGEAFVKSFTNNVIQHIEKCNSPIFVIMTEYIHNFELDDQIELNNMSLFIQYEAFPVDSVSDDSEPPSKQQRMENGGKTSIRERWILSNYMTPLDEQALFKPINLSRISHRFTFDNKEDVVQLHLHSLKVSLSSIHRLVLEDFDDVMLTPQLYIMTDESFYPLHASPPFNYSSNLEDWSGMIDNMLGIIKVLSKSKKCIQYAKMNE